MCDFSSIFIGALIGSSVGVVIVSVWFYIESTIKFRKAQKELDRFLREYL